MKLSIVVSNRDRLDPTTNISKFFLKSLEKQTFQDFELVVADGGSKNIEQLKALEETLPFTFRVVEPEAKVLLQVDNSKPFRTKSLLHCSALCVRVPTVG